MKYTAKISGKTYDLPPRTLSIDEKIESFVDIDKRYAAGEMTRREVVQSQFEFVQACAPGAFDDIETIDVNELLAACLEIIGAYNAPAIKAKNDAALAKLRPVLNSAEIGKVLQMSKVLK